MKMDEEVMEIFDQLDEFPHIDKIKALVRAIDDLDGVLIPFHIHKHMAITKHEIVKYLSTLV